LSDDDDDDADVWSDCEELTRTQIKLQAEENKELRENLTRCEQNLTRCEQEKTELRVLHQTIEHQNTIINHNSDVSAMLKKELFGLVDPLKKQIHDGVNQVIAQSSEENESDKAARIRKFFEEKVEDVVAHEKKCNLMVEEERNKFVEERKTYEKKIKRLELSNQQLKHEMVEFQKFLKELRAVVNSPSERLALRAVLESVVQVEPQESSSVINSLSFASEFHPPHCSTAIEEPFLTPRADGPSTASTTPVIRFSPRTSSAQ
jgi:phage shock protein A